MNIRRCITATLAAEGITVYEAAKEAGLVRSEGKEYVVKDGDIITIDIPNRRIDVDADLESRKKDFNWKFDGSKYPRFLNLFVKNVGSMAHGGIWE